jgi:hypothetical protein
LSGIGPRLKELAGTAEFIPSIKEKNERVLLGFRGFAEGKNSRRWSSILLTKLLPLFSFFVSAKPPSEVSFLGT